MKQVLFSVVYFPIISIYRHRCIAWRKNIINSIYLANKKYTTAIKYELKKLKIFYIEQLTVNTEHGYLHKVCVKISFNKGIYTHIVPGKFCIFQKTSSHVPRDSIDIYWLHEAKKVKGGYYQICYREVIGFTQKEKFLD